MTDQGQGKKEKIAEVVVKGDSDHEAARRA